MKKIYFFLVFSILTVFTLVIPTKAQEDFAKEEAELLVLINQLRTNPSLFLKQTVLPYLSNNYPEQENYRINKDSVTNTYIKSLLTDLRNTKPMRALTFDNCLNTQAQMFASDMGVYGETGHNSTRVGFFGKRFLKCNSKFSVGENCSYGFRQPLFILMQLLIDEDVPSLGHRKNLLNQDYSLIGISIEKHSKYQFNCVMDFAWVNK
jgi:uncharacterized protein YkwD